ncbi:flagellar motor protein MotB [Thalassoglobus sp. JC818]|uniref:flagellar motor protein MotB n=1 Tax=Thalassoglobus sp. JC818 TaxID=3232136 RepID=UPI0034587D98
MKRAETQSKPTSIPRWFITYSDVVTLLMTFFILLLTFANSEPEKFEMMQQTLFGAGGSAGNIGHRDQTLDHASIVMRVRPTSSRLTLRGSEIPPMYTDVISEAMGRGLESLEESSELGKMRSFSFDISRDLFFDSKGDLTDLGRQHLGFLAAQMKKLPFDLTINSASTPQIIDSTKIATYLTMQSGVSIQQVAVGVLPHSNISPRKIRLILIHEN